ncbi:unnamed protein product, partial [Bubo scandiacus]
VGRKGIARSLLKLHSQPRRSILEERTNGLCYHKFQCTANMVFPCPPCPRGLPQQADGKKGPKPPQILWANVGVAKDAALGVL